MSLAVVFSRAQQGIRAPLVRIEVHLTAGLPAFNIVGLPEKAVKESRERVRSALLYNGFKIAVGRVTVNVAPADLPKMGGHYDLPIAIGLLAAQGDLPQSCLDEIECIGELGLMGDLRPVQGVLPMALAAKRAKRHLVLPHHNESEALLVTGMTVYAVTHLNDIIQHLAGVRAMSPSLPSNKKVVNQVIYGDFSDVHGQLNAKRALEIAAAGGHSVLMQGSPGSGKSMLAQRFMSILPPLTEEETIEVASIRSLTTLNSSQLSWGARPFRCPHHTASYVAMVGGGSRVLPGEISLAHHGVLFLDELPEFSRGVLESLREPLEMGKIHIARANRQVEYPAQFQLIAAMNPCPCGYLYDKHYVCRCTPDRIALYQSKISGPLLDRIDLRIEVPRLAISELLNRNSACEDSDTIRQRVIDSRRQQLQRQGKLNRDLNTKECDQLILSSPKVKAMLLKVVDRLKISGRSFYRLIKVAMTIADLQGNNQIHPQDLRESLAFRVVDENQTK